MALNIFNLLRIFGILLAIITLDDIPAHPRSFEKEETDLKPWKLRDHGEPHGFMEQTYERNKKSFS